MRKLFLVTAGLALLSVLAQFYFAGLGVFRRPEVAEGFTAHAINAGVVQGVALLDAVAASCAVPLVYPPITIGGRRYIDGGMRSITNADLAAGCDTVLIVAPFPGTPGSPLGPSHEDEVAELRKTAEVHVVLADEASLQAFGTNPLAPATREPSALAGRAQAAAVVEQLRAFWR